MTTITTTDRDVELRMQNPAFVLPDGFKGIGHLLGAVAKGGVPQTTLELVGLRVSQINGCTSCVQGHWEEAKKAGESDERIITVSAWRESPYFDDAERAALALADALTRLADRPDDAVPDQLWAEVVKHYDEQQVSALILQIATLNLFNRINVTVKEQADRPSWKQAP
jgi:AhpD family alkylhydroperoxidase